MALLKIEAHFPLFCPFIECVKVFLECSCIYLIRLLRGIYIMVSSAKSLTVEVILSGMLLM